MLLETSVGFPLPLSAFPPSHVPNNRACLCHRFPGFELRTQLFFSASGGSTAAPGHFGQTRKSDHQFPNTAFPKINKRNSALLSSPDIPGK